VTLHHGDIVNIVDVSSNLYDNLWNIAPNRNREFTVDQGIDFIFEQSTRILNSHSLLQQECTLTYSSFFFEVELT
jgi:hypothetical protein